MFVDIVKIYVKGGDGGNGMVAFRREKFVPMGGPAGGDGGKGGDVIFEVDEGMHTLMDFRYQRHFKAERGEHGRSKNQFGRNAEDMIVKVPSGTIVTDLDSGELIADLTEHGQRALIAKGGRGGRGNSRFATSRHPAPEIAEKGEPGQERNIQLEMKLIADVGLVGFPSVGKSTLLSVVTSAKPKIADYPFTTLTPNLGVVDVGDGRSFVLADLPGLIEGAHQGAGLGHQFLRHVERTRLLVHVIDMAAVEGRDPYEDFVKIEEELYQYHQGLADRPQIIVANKMDIPEAEENLQRFKEQLDRDLPIIPISAVTREGLRPLLLAIADQLDQIPDVEPVVEEVAQEVVYRPTPKEIKFTVRRENERFIVEGEELERLIKMTDFDHRDSIERFAQQMRRMGVDDQLRAKGASHGDTVEICGLEFEFID
ncbi:GTPase ObgE [Rubeoparvulum massiliense]|uniref:GTPase ObgE n=1 Tax=Rubeoparvulum massiliense TaxID=1631346 RepID=UPI00065DF9C3|nr:GTPase ObgE [Rubeoparvulum massiliense]